MKKLLLGLLIGGVLSAEPVQKNFTEDGLKECIRYTLSLTEEDTISINENGNILINNEETMVNVHRFFKMRD